MSIPSTFKNGLLGTFNEFDRTLRKTMKDVFVLKNEEQRLSSIVNGLNIVSSRELLNLQASLDEIKYLEDKNKVITFDTF